MRRIFYSPKKMKISAKILNFIMFCPFLSRIGRILQTCKDISLICKSHQEMSHTAVDRGDVEEFRELAFRDGSKII